MHKQIQRSLFFRQSFRAALSRKTFNLTILKVTQVRIWSARIQLNVSVHCVDWCTCRRKCDVEGIVWDWEQTQDNNNTHLLGVLLFVSSEWASSSSFCRTKRFSSSATQPCTFEHEFTSSVQLKSYTPQGKSFLHESDTSLCDVQRWLKPHSLTSLLQFFFFR